MYNLTDIEKQRLRQTIRAVYAVPFIDDLEDYVWESVFAYAKGILPIDPLLHTRKKFLFDVVNRDNGIGWSIKAVQSQLKSTIELPCEQEIVIQRADIFKKAEKLGFRELSTGSPPEQLGAALLRHWYEKVNHDAQKQEIQDKRVCVLLKSRDRKHYVFLEEELVVYDSGDLSWAWTDDTRTGLQARQVKDGRLVFRWYPNQKQFFERFSFPTDAFQFRIEPKRLEAREVVALLLAKLGDKP